MHPVQGMTSAEEVLEVAHFDVSLYTAVARKNPRSLWAAMSLRKRIADPHREESRVEKDLVDEP